MSSNINVSPSPLAGEGWGEGAQATTTEVDNIAIRVSNLSKCYPLYDAPRDRLKQFILPRLQRFVGKPPKNHFREFWALKDVSFEIKKGETVGIIGRNGAGKSTLLQILCGTLTPSNGTVEISGRVAALLELGSGFNPEFTGRENVYLNGAVLGIKAKEVATRFDSIVSFAELEEFIDQPVKTYSTGMTLRLAFAVHACADPDILVVDEALAVGDIFFRQKCYRRIETLRAAGCTILFVSHAMGEVEQLCTRGIVLRHGEIVFNGGSSEAVKQYYMLDREAGADLKPSSPQPEPSLNAGTSQEMPRSMPKVALQIAQSAVINSFGQAAYCGMAICSGSGAIGGAFNAGEFARFIYEVELNGIEGIIVAGVTLQNDHGVIVHGKSTIEFDLDLPLLHHSRTVRMRVDQAIKLDLAPGEYTVELGIGAIPPNIYLKRHELAYGELASHVRWLLAVTKAGVFSIAFPPPGRGLQLRHHGVADLPGRCEVTVVEDRQFMIASPV